MEICISLKYANLTYVQSVIRVDAIFFIIILHL